VGKSEDERTQPQNRRLAFKRMAQTNEFKKWIRIEAMRISGVLAQIEEEVDKTMLNTKVEVLVDGKWVENPELKVTSQDIKNLKE
jgi:hypothetical protein